MRTFEPDECPLHEPLVRRRRPKRDDQSKHDTEHRQQLVRDRERRASQLGHEHDHCIPVNKDIGEQDRYALVATKVKKSTSGQMSLNTVALNLLK